MIIWSGLTRGWLVYNPVSARCYMENANTDQLCANPFSIRENTKYGKCMQQATTVFATTNDCFLRLSTSLQLSTKLSTLCMHRQNTLKNMISILVSKENRIKKQLFSRQQINSRKKRQYWFRNCRTDKW